MLQKIVFLLSFVCLSQLLMAQRDSTYYGVSLSGAEWQSGEIYPTTDQLDYYQSKGIRLIRLPLSWERLQPILQGDLDATELSTLFAFIDAIAIRNLKVIIDVHNYARYNNVIIGAPGVAIADIVDLWTKLATQLKSKTCIYGYGIMNEPHDLLSSPTWKDIAQAIVTSIRTVDQSTTIIVGGDSWSSAEYWPNYSDNLKTITDPNTNLLFEAHCYFDSDASGRYVNSYDVDGITKVTGVNRVKPFVNWLKTNNLKGFVGEYGVPNDDSRWLDVLDTFLLYLKANNVGGAYWAGGAFGSGYPLSCDPSNGTDAVQMSVLEKFNTVIPTTPVDTGTSSPNYTVSTNTATIPATGNAKSVTVSITSLFQWSTSSDQTWLSTNPTTGPINYWVTPTMYSGTMTLSAADNTGPARTATVTITFVAPDNTKSTETIVVNQAAGTSITSVSEVSDSKILVYPNPATAYFFINSYGSATVELFNNKGQMIQQSKIMGKESISLEDVSPGLYYVKIITDKTVVTKSLLVK